MVLVIRKAFTFSPPLPDALTLGKHENKGFGLVSLDKVDSYSYFLASPDIITGHIRVTVLRAWQSGEEVIYVNCVSDLQEAEKTLNYMILGFMVSYSTSGKIIW